MIFLHVHQRVYALNVRASVCVGKQLLDKYRKERMGEVRMSILHCQRRTDSKKTTRLGFIRNKLFELGLMEHQTLYRKEDAIWKLI